jgi:hypothetical protein
MQDGGARLVKAFVLVCFALLTHAASANAQARDDDSVAGDVFLGAAFLVWTATKAPEDTSSFAGVAYSGAGLNDWPVPGALFNGGVFVTSALSVGGEFGFRRARSTTVSSTSSGFFLQSEATSSYRESEAVLSAIVRYHARTASIAIQPAGGITFARVTQALTNTHGTWWDSVGPVRMTVFTAPDVTTKMWQLGFVTGVDVVVPAQKRLALVAGARLQGIKRPDRFDGRRAPNMARFIWQLACGFRWTSASH